MFLNMIKKYYILLILWAGTISIIIFTWGSGRLFMIFPALISSVGFYLTRKALEITDSMKNININEDSIKEGLSKIKGKIKAQNNIKSPLEKKEVVYYNIIIEKAKSSSSSTGSIYDVSSYSKIKWVPLANKFEWANFIIEKGKDILLVDNPENADGQWVFEENEIPEIEISTLYEAHSIIKNIVNKTIEEENKKFNTKTSIEEGRMIRYMERHIEDGEDILIYGEIKKVDSEGGYNYYKVGRSKEGIFLFTNEINYDILDDEKKQLNKGLIILVAGIIGMIVAFLWPIIIQFTISNITDI